MFTHERMWYEHICRLVFRIIRAEHYLRNICYRGLPPVFGAQVVWWRTIKFDSANCTVPMFSWILLRNGIVSPLSISQVFLEPVMPSQIFFISDSKEIQEKNGKAIRYMVKTFFRGLKAFSWGFKIILCLPPLRSDVNDSEAPGEPIVQVILRHWPLNDSIYSWFNHDQTIFAYNIALECSSGDMDFAFFSLYKLELLEGTFDMLNVFFQGMRVDQNIDFPSISPRMSYRNDWNIVGELSKPHTMTKYS